MPDPRYRAVLLDVGGTLIECRPTVAEVYAAVISRWGPEVSAAQVEPCFRRSWEAMSRAHPPGLDRYRLGKGGEWSWWGTLLRRVLADLSHPAPWEPVLGELFAAFAEPELWHVFPEVHEVLGSLSGGSLALAVVSNWDSRLPALLTRLELDRYFDAVLVSAIEGIEKPEAAIFARAAQRLGVAPDECVHVGDSPIDDVRGAEGAGMDAVLVDRDGSFDDGFRRIQSLRGLYDIVF